MYTIPEKNIYKLPDGTLCECDPVELPTSQADLIAKAGKEYPTDWLKEQGWGKKDKPAKKKAAAKKAPAKKAPAEKAVKKSEVEDKALKDFDTEDK